MKIVSQRYYFPVFQPCWQPLFAHGAMIGNPARAPGPLHRAKRRPRRPTNAPRTAFKDAEAVLRGSRTNSAAPTRPGAEAIAGILHRIAALTDGQPAARRPGRGAYKPATVDHSSMMNTVPCNLAPQCHPARRCNRLLLPRNSFRCTTRTRA